MDLGMSIPRGPFQIITIDEQAAMAKFNAAPGIAARQSSSREAPAGVAAAQPLPGALGSAHRGSRPFGT